MPLRYMITAALLAADAAAADLDFYQDVFPFLKANCVSCHNKTTTKAGLNMETPELMIQGGEAGPAIVPGKGAESLVVKASQHLDDMEMPPANNKSGAVNLTEAEISILRQWIDQGAKGSTRQERAVALGTFAASVDPIYCVAVSPDGRHAACGRSNRIFIYDLATRRQVAQLADPGEKSGAAHRALVQSLAFSPDGMRLASGSYREVKFWRMHRAEPAPALAKPAAPVDAALAGKIRAAVKADLLSSALSADGRLAAAGCGDGTVRLWDVAAQKPLLELRGGVATARQQAALRRAIASQTLEQAHQKAETARIEAQEKALDVLLGKAREAIEAMKKVLPEKQKALPPATEAKNSAQKEVDTLAARLAAEKSPALEKEHKAAQEKLITARMAEVSALAAVKAAESNVKDAGEDLKRITTAKEANARALAAAAAAITTAKAAQDKAEADLAALKKAVAAAAVKPVAVAFSADSAGVAAFFEDGTLTVWATATGIPLEEDSTAAATRTTLGTAADGTFVAVRSLTRAAGGAPRWALERVVGGQATFAGRVNALCFSPDGRMLAAGGGEDSRSGDILLLDTATGGVARPWHDRHADTVLCLAFSPDGRRLASGAADKTARVCDAATGAPLNLLEGHTHHVTGIAWRADGRVLATAGADGVVVTWDMASGERKKKIEGWSKEVTSLQFLGATNQILTSAGDNRVRIITDEGAEVRSITGLPDYMQAAASTPDGATLIAGGEDSLLRLWDAAGKELAAFGR